MKKLALTILILNVSPCIYGQQLSEIQLRTSNELNRAKDSMEWANADSNNLTTQNGRISSWLKRGNIGLADKLDLTADQRRRWLEVYEKYKHSLPDEDHASTIRKTMIVELLSALTREQLLKCKEIALAQGHL